MIQTQSSKINDILSIKTKQSPNTAYLQLGAIICLISYSFNYPLTQLVSSLSHLDVLESLVSYCSLLYGVVFLQASVLREQLVTIGQCALFCSFTAITFTQMYSQEQVKGWDWVVYLGFCKEQQTTQIKCVSISYTKKIHFGDCA